MIFEEEIDVEEEEDVEPPASDNSEGNQVEKFVDSSGHPGLDEFYVGSSAALSRHRAGCLDHWTYMKNIWRRIGCTIHRL